MPSPGLLFSLENIPRSHITQELESGREAVCISPFFSHTNCNVEKNQREINEGGNKEMADSTICERLLPLFIINANKEQRRTGEVQRGFSVNQPNSRLSSTVNPTSVQQSHSFLHTWRVGLPRADKRVGVHYGLGMRAWWPNNVQAAVITQG